VRNFGLRVNWVNHEKDKMKEATHPFSYYLIFCPVCEVLFLENLDISEKIVAIL
jgi:hypothetical protein